MGRTPLIAFIAVLLVAAIPAWSFLTEPREVISSTPSAYTGLPIPLPVPAGGEACVDSLVFDTDSRVARFGASSVEPDSAPALRVVARATEGGYSAATTVPGGWTGTRQLDVPLRPPSAATSGTLCIRVLDDRPINLSGTQMGRAAARPTVYVDGERTDTELELRFLTGERSSLLSRAGRVAVHAATLKPFGAWWLWLLGVLLLAAAPLLLWRAISTGLADEAAAPARAPLVFPPVAARRWAAAVPGWAWLAAAMALAVLWFCNWSFSTHVFQTDEAQYVSLSRWVQHDFPASLFAFAEFGRGLQRLEVWLLAIPAWLFDSPESLLGGRFLNAVAFASTAIPVYLVGRGLNLSQRWAALPAVVSIAVPWVVVTTSFLAENVAYPACVWALWAIWRTAAEPSAGRDLLAVALLIVAGAARSGLLLLVPVLPVVAAATSWRYVRLRVLREHIVLWAAGALGVLVLILDGLDAPGADGFSQRLAGGYLTQLALTPDFFDRAAAYLSKVVVGTGFLTAVVALPWLAIQLVRPRDRATFAFALLAPVATIALLYSLNTAGPDERYVLYFAPLVLLAATLAIARRELSPLGIGIASGLLAVLLLRVPWQPEQGPFGFFVSPVEMFYSRAIGLRLERYLPGDALTLATLALGAAGVALAVALARRPSWLTRGYGAALIAAVALIVPVQAHYALSKFVNGAGAKSGPDMHARAFVDELVPKGETVGQLVEGVGALPSFFGVWQELQFYNQRLDRVYSFGENVVPVTPDDHLVAGLSFDPRTGRVTSPEPLPDYVALPLQVGTARIRGQVVAAPSYIPVGLMRVARPATLDWSANGFDELGQTTDGTVRFYGTGRDPGPQCAAFAFLAPPEQETRYRIDVEGGVRSSGRVAPDQLETVNVVLPRLAERGTVDVRVSGEGVRVAGINFGC